MSTTEKLVNQLGGLPLGHYPNGTAPGLAMRRRTTHVTYPASPEAYAEAGFNPEHWCEDGVGLWVDVVAALTGMDDRNERMLRSELFANPSEQTRETYYREIAWRVVRWGYAYEHRATGEMIPVPAPGEGEDNWQAIDLLPFAVGAWLIEVVRTAHLPKRSPWPSTSPTTSATSGDQPAANPT